MFGFLLVAIAAQPVLQGRYEFVCDYQTLNPKGVITKIDRVHGIMTAVAKDLTWSDVTLTAEKPGQPWGEPVHPKGLDGFHYFLRDNLFKDGVFKDFDDPEFKQRNLVWDTEMFCQFANDSKRIKNAPLILGGSNVPLGAGSNFRNTNITLQADRHGGFLVVHYQAPENDVNVQVGKGMSMVGKSTYFGEIKLRSQRPLIVSATLEEDVAGKVTHTPAGDIPVHVVRKGTFTRVT
jgi:hypothetical protein